MSLHFGCVAWQGPNREEYEKNRRIPTSNSQLGGAHVG
jgi:hypothetical protein